MDELEVQAEIEKLRAERVAVEALIVGAREQIRKNRTELEQLRKVIKTDEAFRRSRMTTVLGHA